jgi:hypothetical protein
MVVHGRLATTGSAAQGLRHRRGTSSTARGCRLVALRTAETRVACLLASCCQNPRGSRSSRGSPTGPSGPTGMRTTSGPNSACSTSRSVTKSRRLSTAITYGLSSVPNFLALSYLEATVVGQPASVVAMRRREEHVIEQINHAYHPDLVCASRGCRQDGSCTRVGRSSLRSSGGSGRWIGRPSGRSSSRAARALTSAAAISSTSRCEARTSSRSRGHALPRCAGSGPSPPVEVRRALRRQPRAKLLAAVCWPALEPGVEHLPRCRQLRAPYPIQERIHRLARPLVGVVVALPRIEEGLRPHGLFDRIVERLVSVLAQRPKLSGKR